MIYFDNASTTKMLDSVLDKYIKYSRVFFYNPSAQYAPAIELKNQIDTVRQDIANILDCKMDDIYFTKSTTEANNVGIHSILRQTDKKDNPEIITTKIEHSSIKEPIEYLKSNGFNVKYINLKKYGELDLENLKSLLTSKVVAIIITHINSETGIINNIEQVTQTVKDFNPNIKIFIDAAQSFAKIAIPKLDIDGMSMCSHKIHGPKGVAALYLNDKIFVDPIIKGGRQEKGIFSSTQDAAAIVSFGHAASSLYNDQEKNYNHVKMLKERLLDNIQTLDDFIVINKTGSPYILTLCFKQVKGEVAVRMLSDEGILINTGSSCSSSVKGKRFIDYIDNIPHDYKGGTIRISFSIQNTLNEVDIAASKIINVVKRIRKISGRGN